MVGYPFDEEPSIFRIKPLTMIGLSTRRTSYSNWFPCSLEASLSIGKDEGLPTWIDLTLNGQFYTVLPRTYFLLGLGWIRPKILDIYRNQGEIKGIFGVPGFGVTRLGFGTNLMPKKKKFNVRIEAEFVGIRIWLERRLQ